MMHLRTQILTVRWACIVRLRRLPNILCLGRGDRLLERNLRAAKEGQP